MSEDIVIERTVFYCFHDTGPCLCPMCGKPCDWGFYNLIREAMETGRHQEEE